MCEAAFSNATNIFRVLDSTNSVLWILNSNKLNGQMQIKEFVNIITVDI